MIVGSLFSCSETPTTNCDTCDTSHHCDTCDSTHTGPNDTTSHNFTWTEYTISGESNLTGVWVFNDTLIYAIGTYLYSFDGVKWKQIPVHQTGTGRELIFPDFSMFAFSPNDVWIVSSIVDHYIGNGLADEYRNGGGYSCWGTTKNDLFLVANNGNILHFDGSNFEKMSSPTTKDLRSVWGASHNDVWAAGFNSSTAESVLLHFDGTNWVEQNLKEIGDIRPLGHALGEVWAADSASHKIVVTGGSLLHRRTDTGVWRSDSGYIQNRLTDGSFIGLFHIRGNGINDFFATGDGGFISHWNGRSWKRYDNLYNPGDLFYTTNACSQKGNTACVAGEKSGTSWIAIGRRK